MEAVRLSTFPPEALAARARALRRLLDGNMELIFEPEGHTYTYHGESMRSVSSIIEDYSKFDAAKTARSCSLNQHHELYGVPPEEIMAIWKRNADEAAAAGTAVHSFGEAQYMLRLGLTDDLEGDMRSRYDNDRLSPYSPKEAALAAWWDSLDNSRWLPVAKETSIVNSALGYAGTFDLLLYDMETGTFALRDYKTNRDIHAAYRTKMKAPFDYLPDASIGHYTLQMGLYTLQLENLGLPVSGASLIWLRQDGTYEEIAVERCCELARRELEDRKSGAANNNIRKTKKSR